MSAVIVAVPEAEPLVGALRLRHTYDAPLGIPPHVTLLFPFVPADRVAEAEVRLGALVAGHDAFEATFARTARFADVLYLEPEPAGRFLDLTAAIVEAWPEHLPYEGAHEAVVPHLTVAESEDEALLDAIAVGIGPGLPIRQRVEAANLFVEGDDGRWREHSRLPLR